jgi:crotonobetainyl-CoA:carnitine CoA-transferase CaiB-like acyl-CoA transferase
MGALSHIRVLDLSRVLAGPWATQILGDLGAEVIKIEKPGEGDETRRFGPPFLEGADGGRGDATYFLAANRNKQSVAIDFAKPEGAALVRRLARRAHVVVENFKTGTLAKFGLDYESLAAENPALVYCSLTGFGHDGPYKDKAGYDYLIQGMGGLMSVTGQRDGHAGAEPMKVGVAVSDLVSGLYTTIAIQAALIHQARTGEDRHGAVRLPGRRARQSGDELSGGPYAAGAAGQCTSQHRALSGVRNCRRLRDSRHRQ